MTTDLLVPTPLRVTVGYERKLSQPLPQYEHESASIFLQADLGENPTDAIKDAFFTARAAVFEQLGVKTEYVDGVLKEILPEVAPAAQTPPPSAPSNGSPAPTGDGPPQCPKCSGGMWDNRKSNAEAVAGGNPSASKRPDFKCKNKDGCGEGVWLKGKK